MDVWVTGNDYPYSSDMYYVWVDGEVYDSFPLLNGPRLTWAQEAEIARNYREALQQWRESQSKLD